MFTEHTGGGLIYLRGSRFAARWRFFAAWMVFFDGSHTGIFDICLGSTDRSVGYSLNSELQALLTDSFKSGRQYCSPELVFSDAVFKNLSVANYPDGHVISVNANPIWMIVDVPYFYRELVIFLQLTDRCFCNLAKVAILTGIEDQLDHHTMLA